MLTATATTSRFGAGVTADAADAAAEIEAADRRRSQPQGVSLVRIRRITLRYRSTLRQ